MVDLHVHSTASDGTNTPKELVLYALTHDITAFALTDHDTTCGLSEACKYAAELSSKVCEANPYGKSVEVIPGIEFSTERDGHEIHIVGLFIDYKSSSFLIKIQPFMNSRDGRNEKMCALLTELNMPVSMKELLNRFPNCVITRAHFARFLFEHGYVNSIKEAFERYVGDHGSCYVRREKVTPAEAIHLILEAGGIPVLAHPTLYHMGKDKLDELVSNLKDAGLIAIEGFYSTYTQAETKEIHALAQKYDLLISGGSDFHGQNKPGISFGTGFGKLYIHETILETLRGALPTSLPQ